LAILGRMIDVATPFPLKPGSTLPVVIDTSGGALKLLIQKDAAPPQAAKASAAPTLPGNLMVAVQAAITEALWNAGASAKTLAAPEEPAAPPQSQPSAQAEQQPAHPISAESFGALPNGANAEARVIAMVEAKVARLSILGRAVDVATPFALKPGSTVPVVIDSSGGLKLPIQRDAAPSQPGKGSATSPATASPGNLIVAMETAITEALLHAGAPAKDLAAPEEPAARTAAPPSPRPPNLAEEPPVQPNSRVDAAKLHGPATAPSSDVAPNRLALIGASPHAAEEASQTAPRMLGFGAPVQSSANAVSVPFQIMQMPFPVEVRIKREEDEDGEADKDGEDAEKQRKWSATVSVAAVSIGLVHVSIGLRGNAISVRLSSDQAESAMHLRAWLPELKSFLEAADFVVEDLSARLASNEPPPDFSIFL
jgi:hypothetical protein